MKYGLFDLSANTYLGYYKCEVVPKVGEYIVIGESKYIVSHIEHGLSRYIKDTNYVMVCVRRFKEEYS